MARVNFAEVYQARDVAIQAAELAGNSLPMLDFLSRYGRYLPQQQLLSIGYSYFDQLSTVGQSRADFLQQVLEAGVSGVDTGQGERTVDTLVSRIGPGGIQEFRTIRSELFGSEGINELYTQIRSVLEAWQRNSNVQGFAIIDPVWRVD